MKILHLCYSDFDGGAARAAYRLHQAQRKANMDSHMLVINKCSDDCFVHSVSSAHKLRIKVAGVIARRLLRFQKSNNTVHHSLNVFPSGLLDVINKLSPDVVNLHWLGGEMFSIGEISHITQPVVWTLHDMWAFSGCEHYDDESQSERYLTCYNSESRNQDHSGIDLDRLIFLRKEKAWSKKRFNIVTPSNWLAGCVKKSALFENQPIQRISNCIDHAVYKPLSREIARKVLNLPQDKKLVLFGAMSSTSDPRKGYHLLIPALQKLKVEGKSEQIELVVFGASHGITKHETGIVTHYMGRLYDDTSLTLLYNAADIFVAPSLQDNLPNTLVESLACGTPCVAFAIGGMGDLIDSDDMGIIAETVTHEALALAIFRLIGKDTSPLNIAKRSCALRSESKIATDYLNLYNSIL